LFGEWNADDAENKDLHGFKIRFYPPNLHHLRSIYLFIG